jgi:hypothetical protein
MKMYGGAEVPTSCIPNLSIDGDEWSVSWVDALPPGNDPLVLGGPQSKSGHTSREGQLYCLPLSGKGTVMKMLLCLSTIQKGVWRHESNAPCSFIIKICIAHTLENCVTPKSIIFIIIIKFCSRLK